MNWQPEYVAQPPGESGERIAWRAEGVPMTVAMHPSGCADVVIDGRPDEIIHVCDFGAFVDALNELRAALEPKDARSPS